MGPWRALIGWGSGALGPSALSARASLSLSLAFVGYGRVSKFLQSSKSYKSLFLDIFSKFPVIFTTFWIHWITCFAIRTIRWTYHCVSACFAKRSNKRIKTWNIPCVSLERNPVRGSRASASQRTDAVFRYIGAVTQDTLTLTLVMSARDEDTDATRTLEDRQLGAIPGRTLSETLPYAEGPGPQRSTPYSRAREDDDNRSKSERSDTLKSPPRRRSFSPELRSCLRRDDRDMSGFPRLEEIRRRYERSPPRSERVESTLSDRRRSSGEEDAARSARQRRWDDQSGGSFRQDGNRSPAAAGPYAAKWVRTFGDNEHDDIDVYIDSFNMFARGNGWPEDFQKMIFIASLRGKAGQVAFKNLSYASMAEVYEQMRRYCAPLRSRSITREEFRYIQREKRETAQEYLQRVKNCANRAFAAWSEEAVDEMARERFLHGQPAEIGDRLIGHVFSTIEDILLAVVGIEAALNRARSRRDRRYVGTIGGSESWSDDDKYSRRYVGAGGGADVVCWPEEDKRGYNSRYRGYDSSESEYDLDDRAFVAEALSAVPCYRDGSFEEEHAIQVLEAKIDKLGNQKGVCFFCKRSGHRWMTCYRLRDILMRNGMRDPRSRNNSRASSTSTRSPDDNRPTSNSAGTPPGGK